MRKLAHLLLFLAVLPLASACEDEQGTLYGVVRDGRELQPLADVEIGLTSRIDSGETMTTTDEDGRYRFSDIERGPYELKATLEGYIETTRYSEVFGGEDVELNLTMAATADGAESMLTIAVRDAVTGFPVNMARVDVYAGPSPANIVLQTTVETDVTGVLEVELPAMTLDAVRFIQLQAAAVGYLNAQLEFNITYEQPTASVVITMTPV